MVDMRKNCKSYVIFTAVIYTCFYIILKIVKSSNKRIIPHLLLSYDMS